MNSKKWIAMVLALMLLVSLLTACGGQTDTTPTETKAAGAAQETTQASAETTEATTEEPATGIAPELPSFEAKSMPEKLTLEKVLELNGDYRYLDIKDGGIVYTAQDGKKGLLSFDGKHDTGAIYTVCSAEGNYFTVTTASVSDAADISGLNCAGLVDATGKELLPQQYAAIDVLNDRFAHVCQVTHTVESKDDALVYYSNEPFSFMPDEDDTFFGGTWSIVDLTTGKPVPGATGTKPYTRSAKGNFVTFVTDGEERLTVNAQGEPLPEGGNLLENGLYTVETRESGTLYDTEGRKLFSYDPQEISISGISGGFLRSYSYKDGETSYTLLDYTGKAISGQFPGSPQVYGSLVYCQYAIYDFAGNKLMDIPEGYLSMDEVLQSAWYVSAGDERTMIRSDCSVICTHTRADNLYVTTSDFLISTTQENTSYYYCLKDEDFTIKGYSVGPWMVEQRTADGYDLYDTISGEVLLSGYKDFGYGTSCDTDNLLYARTQEGIYEIYRVK